MGLGTQSFSISRNGVQIASGTGGLQVTTTCSIYSDFSFVSNDASNFILCFLHQSWLLG